MTDHDEKTGSNLRRNAPLRLYNTNGMRPTDMVWLWLHVGIDSCPEMAFAVHVMRVLAHRDARWLTYRLLPMLAMLAWSSVSFGEQADDVATTPGQALPEPTNPEVVPPPASVTATPPVSMTSPARSETQNENRGQNPAAESEPAAKKHSAGQCPCQAPPASAHVILSWDRFATYGRWSRGSGLSSLNGRDWQDPYSVQGFFHPSALSRFAVDGLVFRLQRAIITTGLNGALGKFSGEAGGGRIWSLGVRGGTILTWKFADILAFWPRCGLTYTSFKQQAFSSPDSYLRERTLVFTLDPVIVIAPISHFAVVIGAFLDLPVTTATHPTSFYRKPAGEAFQTVAIGAPWAFGGSFGIAVYF